MDSLYRLWVWFGSNTGYIRRYNKERDESLVRAKEALEHAFTPRLRKLLETKVNKG